jgi:carboxymethylenebutenolidase
MRSAPAVAALLVLAGLVGGCDKDVPQSPGSITTEDLQHVESMAREHATDTTEPSAAAAAPLQPVNGAMWAYAEVAGELVYGYFVSPQDMVEPLPALIVIHEWWGLNDNMKAMADRLAGQGYMVLAVDLFGGSVAGSPAQARELMLHVVENPNEGRENIRQAYQFLAEAASAPRVGVIGWCFGGGWALTAALELPTELSAAVIYYGQVTDDQDKLRTLQTPILGHFGANDTGIPIASVEQFRDILESLRKDYTIEIYPGVGHAFANPTGQNYNAAAADKAWKMTLEFLNDHMIVPVAE